MTKGAKMKTLLAGLAFGESPRWHGDCLWLADWGTKEVIAVDVHGNGEVVVRVSFPSFPMCIDWLSDDRQLIVSSRAGLLWRRELDGSLVTHADLTGLADKSHP
jgi:sugar lactone lactonase YvrE